MNISGLTRRVAKLAIDNSPTILTTIGVVGTVSTAYLAGRASFEAADIIRLKEGTERARAAEYPEDPREILKQRVRLVWRLYIPAASVGALSVACIIGANHIGSRRTAGLAAAYTITERTFEEYRAKVIEKIGERKEEQVRDAIQQDRVNESWVDDDSVEVHGKPNGEVCYDKYSDRYLWHTVEGLRAAQNDLNESVLHHGYASLADFYHILDMPAPSYSYEVGWSSDRKMRLRFSSVLTPVGRPVIAFEFDVDPIRDYNRFH